MQAAPCLWHRNIHVSPPCVLQGPYNHGILLSGLVLVVTPAHAAAGCAPAVAAGALLLSQLPHTQMELVPGVAPTALLVGTMEAAVRSVVTLPLDELPDLACVAALVGACCRALMQQSSQDCSSDGSGGGSSIRGGGSSSSSDGDGSSHSTCGAGAGARAGIVLSLADLAVTGRIACTYYAPLLSQAESSRLLSGGQHLCVWSSVAADLLRLATHEVAAGRTGRDTLALAAAAQHLRGMLVQHSADWTVSASQVVAADIAAHGAAQGQHTAMVHRVAAGMQGMLAHLVALDAAVQRMLVPVNGAAPAAAAGEGAVEPASPGAAEGPPAQAAVAPVSLSVPMEGGTSQQQQQQQKEEECSSARLQGPAHAPKARDPVVHSLQELARMYKTGRVCNLQLQMAGCSLLGCCRGLNLCTSAALAAGRRKVLCGGCGVARYCCREHQEKDWPRHSQLCRRLARARAAAAGCNSDR